MASIRIFIVGLSLPLLMGVSPCPPASEWQNTRPVADKTAVSLLNRALTHDQNLTNPPAYSSRAFLHKNKAGEVVKTPFIFISIHGLYNNPTVMTDPERFAFDSGFNVVSLRLAGHFEYDREALDRIKLEQWQSQVQLWRELASPLGESIYWMGHSTGALLGLMETLEDTSGVKGLFLFSPALQLHPASYYALKSLDKLGVSGWAEDKLRGDNPKRQYNSVPAGLEVIRLGDQFRASLDDDKFAKLKNLPITIVDTPKDIVVDVDTNEAFIMRLAKISPRLAHYRRVFRSRAMIHDSITLASESGYRLDVAPLLKSKICTR